jgi:ABC-type polar amino acid transport system ATPase subunit
MSEALAVPSQAPAVEVHNLVKDLGGTRVLNDMTLSVQRGEVAAVIGRSGSGKSTLLRCLNGLIPVDGGEVRLNGRLIADRRGRAVSGRELRMVRARMPMVFQRFNLYPHMDAVRNVSLAPVHVLGQSRQEARARAEEALVRVGLSHRLHSYPHQLSGGEQQRVGIARALVMNPDVILLDEPTSALDPELVGEVLKILLELASEGMTMIVVTHEMRFAQRAADRVFFVSAGTIVENGPPAQIFDAPSHSATQAFIRAISG